MPAKKVVAYQQRDQIISKELNFHYYQITLKDYKC